MKTSRTVLGMFAVAALAYAAGHVNLFSGGPNAWAQARGLSCAYNTP